MSDANSLPAGKNVFRLPDTAGDGTRTTLPLAGAWTRRLRPAVTGCGLAVLGLLVGLTAVVLAVLAMTHRFSSGWPYGRH